MAKSFSTSNMHECQPNQTTNHGLEQQYLCYPFSASDKFRHNQGGYQIVMPASALTRITSLKYTEHPMFFSIQNASNGQASYCSILEFSADEGSVVVPDCLMSSLSLKKGQFVTLNSFSYPKDTCTKMKSHKSNLNNHGLSRPRSVLEYALKDFSCLNLDDTSPTYEESSMVETEFAQPLDDQSPGKPSPRQQQQQNIAKVFVPFTGFARRLNGQPASASTLSTRPREVEAAKETISFRPFTGSSRRLEEKQQQVVQREEEDLSSYLKNCLRLSVKRKFGQTGEEGNFKKSRME